MTSQSRSDYASAPFKFIIDGEPLYIHADLASRHSKPLDRMMHGPMAEGQKGFATLEDVDEGTFVRFIEWAYKGYYAAGELTTAVEEGPDPASQGTDDDHAPNSDEALVSVEADQSFSGGYNVAEPPPEPLEVEDQWGSWGGAASISKKRKSKSKMFNTTPPTTREDLRQSFKSRKPVVRKSAIEIPSPRRNEDSAEIYSDTFLSHARLYVFAEKYDIEPLRKLTLDELHAALKEFHLYVKRTGDIIDLLQYIYANTGESREGVEDMRTLMTQYVVFQMDKLMKDKGFMDLMMDRDFSDDFLKMVAKRI